MPTTALQLRTGQSLCASFLAHELDPFEPSRASSALRRTRIGSLPPSHDDDTDGESDPLSLTPHEIRPSTSNALPSRSIQRRRRTCSVPAI